MRAYVCRRYGGPEVVELDEVPTPTPQEGEVLVRIHATTVTAADWRVRALALPRGFGLLGRLALGLARPRQPILGTELAGVVARVGPGVTRFKSGDAVLAFTGGKMGCHAEYRVVPEDGPIVLKPGKLSFEEAAAIPFGGTTALHYLRKARAKAGEKVLVVGASGNVGTSLVQLARHLGCEVTGVTSTRNLALVQSLGAHAVIDYTQEDFTARGETYDVIADTVGATSFARCRTVLKRGGRFLAISGDLPQLLGAALPRAAGKRVIAGPAAERAEDLAELARLVEAGALSPVIDRRYAFPEMRDAHAYVETRRKRGSVVVTIPREG